jgi:hypothetical protein
MKTFSIFACAILVLCAPTFAAEPSTQPAADAFEKMKSLAGEWKGKDEKGEDAGATFELDAGNSVLMEKMHMHMITMYTLDNDRVLLTHYCAAQNQPRMTASALADDGKTLSFKFLDGTGMKSKNDGHMHALKINFVDADHIAEEWTFQADGKDQFTGKIKLERVKK